MSVCLELEKTDGGALYVCMCVCLYVRDRVLRVVLFCLNVLLLVCSVRQVLSPHFEIMFLLSIGLTACYFLYVFCPRIHVPFYSYLHFLQRATAGTMCEMA